MPNGKQVGTTQKKNGVAHKRVKSSAPKPRYSGLSDRFSGMGPMIEAPRAMARQSRGTVPRISSSRTRGGVRIHHMEWITDLAPGSAAFSSTAYPINPGVGTLFPWLASVASRFDSYRFSNLQFSYEARASSDTVGTVSIAVNYDASDAAPTSKAELNSLETRVDTVPWQCAAIRCVPSELDGTILKHKVRQGLIPNTDVKMYDAGNLIVVTSGVTISPAFLGEIWVTYDVELFSPLLADSFGGTIVSGGSLTTTNVLGTASVPSGALPVAVSATGLVFNQTFEGVFNLFVETTTAVPAITIGGTAICGVIWSGTFNPGYTTLITYAVSATLGQTITLTSSILPSLSTAVLTPGPYDILSQLVGGYP